MEIARCFDPVPRTVREARHFVGSTVEEWRLDPGDVELLVSELATNAVVHARTGYQISVSTIGPDGFRVAVTDDDPTPPRTDLLASDDGLGGRGVAMVVCLSKHWGCDPAGAGKTVWFEL